MKALKDFDQKLSGELDIYILQRSVKRLREIFMGLGGMGVTILGFSPNFGGKIYIPKSDPVVQNDRGQCLVCSGKI
jgi:hypothetical protein